MAKISLKKKAGGTKVGNAIRSAVSTVKNIGSSSQGANVLKATAIPGAIQKSNTNATIRGIADAQKTTNQQTQAKAVASKNSIIKAGTTGIVSTLANQGNKVGGAMNNLSSKISSNSRGGSSNNAISTNGSLNPNMMGDSSITSLRSTNASGTGVNNISTRTSSIPTSNIINTQNTGMANNEFNYPDPGDINYESYVPGSIEQQKIDLEAEQKKTEDNFLANLMNDFNDRETASDIDAKLQKDLGIKEKQKAVSDLTGQLNTIVNRGQANQLSLIGQGRGIPEAIIGGQQAQIGRETAIAALPVQAQLEAAQGNLEMANDSLDRMFKIYSEEADRDFAFKKEVRTFVYQAATDKQKKKLDELGKMEERAYQEKKDLQKEASEYKKIAIENGQASLAGKISVLAQNVNSPTYQEDFANLISKLQDPVKTAQLRKLNAEIAALAPRTDGGVNEDLTAYAAQYSDTGKLPSPAELKLSGLSVGQVTAFAKQIPKSKGAVVSIQTGTKSNSISAEAEKDFQKLYNVTEMTKRLKELDKKRVGGLISGTVGAVFGSQDQGEYLTLRKAIVDEMSRMQSGAALTPDEIAVYNDYLPGRFSETLGLGRDSYKKITSFETAMNQKLQNRLSNNGLSVYGYSTVKVGNKERVVGEILDIGGVNYRVLPDGNLTDIL